MEVNLKKIDDSIIYGYGSQGDRFLINQICLKWNYICNSSSGILGLIFYIFLSLICLFLYLKNFLLSFKIKDKKNFTSSIVVLLILLRSILESSYAVFSVDFILFILLLNYLNKFS